MKAFCGFFAFAAALAAAAAGPAAARTATAGETIAVQDMQLTVPDGWRLSQDAKDQGTIVLGFKNGTEDLTLYVKGQTGMDMRSVFVNGSEVVSDVRNVARNRFTWKVLETRKSFTPRNTTYSIASFMTELNGATYYGYSRAGTQAKALENVTAFLGELR